LSQAEQSMERLFRALANHSDLIAKAYFNGTIYSDRQNQRTLNQLKQLKVLVDHGDDGFRISGRLSQFLDSALSSDRIRRLDTDLSSWIDTLEQQIGLYQDAWRENRLDDVDHYLLEIQRLVFDLADNLEENTSYLLMLVNSRFANVRTLAEKQKQNTFYIARLEKLVNAISALQPEFLLEYVEEQPELHQLLERQLLRLLPKYQQRLQDILDKLKIFLFELRQIEVRAQLVQSFAFYLRQNPDYQPLDWSEHDQIPDHWNRIQPLALSAHADPMDHSVEQELVEITQKIRIDSDTLLAKQKQRRLNAVTLNPTEKQGVQVPKYRRQLAAYMAKVRQQAGRPLSALAFQQVFANDVEPTIWLACVMNECLKQQHKSLQIEWREVSQGTGFTGNKKICDIVLHCQDGER
jgi:hypothetical protein